MTDPNFNLFFAIAASATTIFLGLLVLLHSKEGVSSKIFIAHAGIGSIWAIVNYISLTASLNSILFWIRLVIFFAVPHVFLFLLFVLLFPDKKLIDNKRQFWGAIILMGLMMALAVSPYVFSGFKIVDDNVVPVPGPLIPVFTPLLILAFLASVFLVFKKYFRTRQATRRQWLSIGIGLVSAYVLLIFFVFMRVSTLGDTTYVPYSPLFLLPIFTGAAYAIFRHHLFDIKIIVTEVLVFLLLLASFFELFVATSLLGVILGVFVTAVILFVGILLIRSVLREVKQREQIAEQAMILEKQKSELEKLSNFKTQLLSFASHQLKAPMAVIKGYASILLEGIYGPVKGKVKETVLKMKDSSDELIGLVNTLLDLRKIDEGRMEYEFADVNLGDLTDHVVEGVRQLAEKKNLALTFEKPKEQIMVKADATKLSQVIGNLVENAIKYTPEGSVAVSMNTENEDVIVSVKDSGLGMSQNLIDHLFEEFTRDDRVKKEIRGTGLGLYIAKKMIEAHDGTVWAESEGEGKGSTFFVKLKKL